MSPNLLFDVNVNLWKACTPDLTVPVRFHSERHSCLLVPSLRHVRDLNPHVIDPVLKSLRSSSRLLPGGRTLFGPTETLLHLKGSFISDQTSPSHFWVINYLLQNKVTNISELSMIGSARPPWVSLGRRINNRTSLKSRGAPKEMAGSWAGT